MTLRFLGGMCLACSLTSELWRDVMMILFANESERWRLLAAKT